MNKIAWVSDTPEAIHVGNSRVCREMTRHFKSQFDVHYVGFATEEHKVNTVTKHDGCKVYNVTRNNHKNIVIESLRKINPDIIVLSHDPWLFLPYINQLKQDAILSKALIVGLFTIDGSPVSAEWAPVLKACDIIFTPSEWGKKEMLNFDPGLLVYVAPHGIDNNAFTPFGKHPEDKDKIKTFIDKSTANSPICLDVKDKFCCFFIGNNQDRKGLGSARDAWFKFAEGKTDVKWILVTHPIDGKNKVCFPPTMFEHSTIIHFNCVVQEQDLIGFYHCSDFMLYPTMGDGFSLICLEALACGCTPIVTNWSSQTDFCNKNNSIMLDYSLLRGGFGCHRAIVDSDYLADVLEKQYDDWKNNKEAFSTRIDKLRQNGYATASRYKWGVSSQKMMGIIKHFKDNSIITKDFARKI